MNAKKLVAGDSCIFVRYFLSPCLLSLLPMDYVCAVPEELWLESQVIFYETSQEEELRNIILND